MAIPPPASLAIRKPGGWLEHLSVWHASIFVVAASWGFGGNIYWIRTPLALWGSLALGLTLAGAWRRLRRQPRRWWPVWWLLPITGFTFLVLLSSFNPNYSATPFFDSLVYRPVAPPYPWLPSSARPELALKELWLFNGLYLTGLNLALNVRRRRALRAVLLVLTLNAVLLAVFGSVQKLAGASGLFFGLQRSPNPAFFSTFIYHNHWSAFALLSLGACLALAGHYAARPSGRDFWHTPGWPLLCGGLLVAAAIPLSTSRSVTVLLLVLLGVVAARVARRIHRSATRSGGSARGPLLALALVTVAVLAAIGWVGGPVLQARLDKTHQQLSGWAETGDFGGRARLYRDTWRMGLDRPWTGWGFESFETVYVRYNSHTSPRDRLIRRFDQAHSDWLQAFAETGAIGTTLLLLMAGVPLATTRKTIAIAGGLSRLLFLTCGLVAAYAWVEFPFANPAVTLAFWILFFVAIRYAALSDT